MKPTLLVMAAGMAARYGGLKQTEPVGPAGETFLDYAVFDARRAGFHRVVFVIRRDMADPFTPVLDRLAPHVDVATVYQELDDVPEWFRMPQGRTRPWGTAHAILAARRAIQTPFTALNADDFYGAPAYRLAAGFLTGAAPPDCCGVVALPVERTLSESGPVNRALCQAAGEWLLDIEEVRGLGRDPHGGVVAGEPPDVRRFSGRELVSVNMWAFTPAIFDRLADRFSTFLGAHGSDPDAELVLPDAIGALIRDGLVRVRVLEAPGPWFGITHRGDLPKVREALGELVRRGEYPAPLWSSAAARDARQS